MGCNSSKREDIQQSRQRVNVEHADRHEGPLHGATGATPSRMIGGVGFGSPDTPGDTVLGTSYTDERDNDRDYFKFVMDKTASSFIDVSQSATAIDPHDAAERANEYLSVHSLFLPSILRSAVGAVGRPVSSIELPVSIVSEDSVVGVLSQPYEGDWKEVERNVELIVGAVAAIKPVSVEPLVVQLPDLEVGM